MDKETYAATQQILLDIARKVVLLQLDDFLAAIERADTLGPILDPTLYRAGVGSMMKIERIASACRAFQREIHAVGI